MILSSTPRSKFPQPSSWPLTPASIVSLGTESLVRQARLTLAFLGALMLIGCAPIPELRCLVSPLRGTVVSRGTPVVGAVVKRKYDIEWYDKHVEDITQTDSKGQFDFAAVWRPSALYVPHQPSIQEYVSIQYGGRSYPALAVTKHSYSIFDELDEIRFQELAKGRDRLSKKRGALFLACDLDKMPPE